jgi:Tfp pilus assembly PilM family ATPase/Tfp pilus assembly protein PilN
MLSAKTVLGMLKTSSPLGMLRTKTALGIDISETLINLALLKKGKNGVQLLKTASSSVPDGVIKNGNIEDYATLSKAIRELKTRNKIRASRAAVSLLARPVLVQIMDIPKQVPTNIRQFIYNELKRCIVLSGKKIASDFYGIGSRERTGNSRLFVVATDWQKVTEIAKACNQAGLNVEAIEPPLLAYARAFYDKKIAGKFDCNVLMAILQGNALTICVFRKQTVDFVRTKDISKETTEPDKLCQWLADQINAIIQFYDVEVPDSPGNWEISVIANESVQLPDDAEKSLKAKVAGGNLQVRTPENAYLDTPVWQSGGSDRPSPVAIGLAMKLLGTEQSNLRINLLPPELARVTATKKDALITANIAAAILLLMVLAAGGLALMAKKVNENIAYKKQTQSLQDIRTLLREQELIDRQIKQLSDRADLLNVISSSHDDVDWPHLLNDIRLGTPKTVRITSLFAKGSSRMALEGLSLSYEDVHLFVDMLNKSEHIDSASLSEAEKDNRTGGLVRYAIECSLSPRKRKITDVN